MVLGWHWGSTVVTEMVLRWYWDGTGMALRRHCGYTEMVLGWCWDGTGMVLGWTGIFLGFLVLRWCWYCGYWDGTVMVPGLVVPCSLFGPSSLLHHQPTVVVAEDVAAF